jgi:hypothetical protein
MISPGARSPVLAQTVTVRSAELLIMKAETNEAMIKAKPIKYLGVRKNEISRHDFSRDFMVD